MNILLWIVAALGVVCIALAVLFIVVRLRNNDLAKALSTAKTQNNNLMLAKVHLQDDLDTARAQRDKLNTENANLSEALEKTRVLYNTILAQHANLSKALLEAHAEVERLNKPDLATLPLQEAVKPEHPTRKKRGAQ